MKRLFVVFIVVFLYIDAGITQPWPHPFECTSVLSHKTVGGDCFEIRWNFNNNDIFYIDCPQYNENKSWAVTIIKTECNGDCWISYDVIMNELEILKLGDFAYFDSYSTTIDLKPYILDEYNKRNGNKLEIAILMTKHCITGASETTLIYHNIQIVGKNNDGTYSIFDNVIYEDPPGMIHPCEEARNDQDWMDAFVTCCGATRTIQFGWDSKIINQSGHPGVTSLAVNFGASGFGGSLQQEYQIPIQFLEKVKFSGSFSSVTLKAGVDGICYYPAIVTTYGKVVERIMQSDCDPTKPDIQIGVIDHYYPANYALLSEEHACKLYKLCKQQGGQLKYRRNSGGIIARTNCSGTLIMDYSNVDEVYSYTWVLPDGSMVEGGAQFEITEPGLYKCIVQDMCCNKFEFQFNNCDKLTYGPWSYNSASKQYCREVTCQCGDIAAFRESNTYTQCVSPSRYDGGWNFDNGKKKCTKHAYWTDQDGNEIDLTLAVSEEDILAGDENVVKEPIVDDHYDDVTKQCVRDYYCEPYGIIFITESSAPNFYGSLWDFNSTDLKCYREVYCFNNSIPETEKDSKKADINWTFNLQNGVCEPSVYCDGFKIYNNPIPPHLPYYISEWTQHDPTYEQCSKQVLCDYESGYEQITVPWKAVNIQQPTQYCLSIDPETPYEVDYYCGDEIIRRVCQNFPGPTVPNSSLSNFEINSQIDYLIFPNPTDKGVNISIESNEKNEIVFEIYSLNGELSYRKENTVNKGRNLIQIEEIKNFTPGLYFLKIISKNHVFSYKVIKQ